MSIVYSEIVWLSTTVLVLTAAALIGLWRRQDLSAIEPAKPILLTPAERELLLHERTEALQKAQSARIAAKQARRMRRRQLAAEKNRPATT